MKIFREILSNILFVLALVMVLALGLITPVIGIVQATSPLNASHSSPLHIGEGEAEPPCKDGWLLIYNYVPETTHSHVAPCGYLVRFAETGTWELAGNVPLVLTKAYHYPLCRVTAAGRIKAKPGCAVVVRADASQVEDGTSWRFTLSQVVAAP